MTWKDWGMSLKRLKLSLSFWNLCRQLNEDFCTGCVLDEYIKLVIDEVQWYELGDLQSLINCLFVSFSFRSLAWQSNKDLCSGCVIDEHVEASYLSYLMSV